MKLLSLVIPVFNESENIRHAYAAISAMAEGLPQFEWEFIFTDNHSTDGSDDILAQLAGEDARVRVARFSKNFGYQHSIYAAFALCSGAAAIQLDCDLQDPPELIPRFVEEWEKGHQVVYGVRTSRQEGFFITQARRAFYRILQMSSPDDLPADAGDFRLIDRAVIDELTRFYDYNPYLRGAIAWMGFAQKGIPYARNARERGVTKFNFSSLLRLSVDGLLAHSTLPLRVATGVGFLSGSLAVIGIAVYLGGRFFFGQDWPAGFATIVSLLLVQISLTAFFFGIVGEYLNRLYLQSKGRPIVIIESSHNFARTPASIRAGEVRPPLGGAAVREARVPVATAADKVKASPNAETHNVETQGE